MTTWPREELEQAFRHYFMTGIVYEDWTAWSKIFTDDATYHDHFWGTFHGSGEIEKFLETTMSGSPMVYSALMWYVINPDGRIVYQVSNRADSPDPDDEVIDFTSLQVITYAGEGRFSSEEDWWIMHDMKRFVKKYTEALARTEQPDFPQTMSRRDFGPWVDWARPEPGHVAKPSWLGKGVKPVLYMRDMDFGERTA